ncbi:MAG: hypothetical protein U0176_10035 [Bacteroidia bacterium]
MNGDTVAALARAGCEEVWMGAESGSQRILDAMDKGITVAQIREARTLLKQHGIRTAFSCNLATWARKWRTMPRWTCSSRPCRTISGCR